MKQQNFIIVLIIICFSGCILNQQSKVVMSECNFEERDIIDDEVRDQIWGSPTHAAFDKTYKRFTSSKLLPRGYQFNKASLSEIKNKKKEYKLLEQKLVLLKELTEEILNNIKNGQCKAGGYTHGHTYLKEQKEGVDTVLKEFPRYYKMLDEKLLLEQQKIKKKRIDSFIKNQRRKLYRKAKGTTSIVNNMTFQVEDFHKNFLYVSVKNNSDKKIMELYINKCDKYQNESGGQSCFWRVNGHLSDHYGNSYRFSMHDFANSLQGQYKFVNSMVKLYPGDKVYLRFSLNQVIKKSNLTLHLNNAFTGYSDSGVTLRFTESFPESKLFMK